MNVLYIEEDEITESLDHECLLSYEHYVFTTSNHLQSLDHASDSFTDLVLLNIVF